MSSMPPSPRGLELAGVTEQERRIIQQAFANPLEIPPIFKGWLEAYLEPIFDRLGAAAGVRVPPQAGYGTSLPASPTDSDQFILTDSVTSPTYEWRFRYNANSTNADKWGFIGGPEIHKDTSTDVVITSASYVDPSTLLTFTVPRAGVYRVLYGGDYVSGSIGHLALKRGTAATSDADSINEGAQGNQYRGVRAVELAGLAAGDVLKLQARVVTPNGTFTNQWLRIYPVRVS